MWPTFLSKIVYYQFMQKSDLEKFNLPKEPGVYFFKNAKEILYIGKATSLKDRVRSYFADDIIHTRGSRIVDMVALADTIDFETTDTVLEALIKEANLIKRYEPKYNIKEKDNKSYSYVCITKDSLPKVVVERGRTISFKNSEYESIFGPFPSQQKLFVALKIIRKIFPFITDKTGSKLYAQIGLEPDMNKDNFNDIYKKNIRNIKLFFQGKKSALIKTLEKEMMMYAKKLQFERAQQVKKQIFALEHINDVALIDDEKVSIQDVAFRIEAYDVAHMKGSHSVGVMAVFENGVAQKSAYRKFILRNTPKGDDLKGLVEILTRRFKHDEWPLPDLVVIDGGKTQLNTAQSFFKSIHLDTNIVSVVKDDSHKAREILGDKSSASKYEKQIILINSEAHRFAIEFYRSKHRKSLLN
jgi:excinuclease ABC subunit C